MKNENKLEHYNSNAYQPLPVNTSQSLMQSFFYTNLMFTYEHVKITWRNKVVMKILFSFFLNVLICKQCPDCHQISQVEN